LASGLRFFRRVGMRCVHSLATFSARVAEPIVCNCIGLPAAHRPAGSLVRRSAALRASIEQEAAPLREKTHRGEADFTTTAKRDVPASTDKRSARTGRT